MASVAITVVLCVWLGVNNAQVAITPEISSTVALGILTSRTMMLRQPQCYFDEVEGLPCSLHQCEIWLVVARGNGEITLSDPSPYLDIWQQRVQKFESQHTSSDILSKSPYPDAFLDDASPNFFITRVGVQNSFPCAELPGIRYFQVGAEGKCDTDNCNGVLPTGATVRVKYILVDPANRTIESGTRWSQPITLLTPRASSSIDESTWKRSGAMVVITVILSCSLAVLTLLLVVALLQGSFGLTQGPPEIPEPPSLSHGVRRYNTHNLNSSEYYSNIRI